MADKIPALDRLFRYSMGDDSRRTISSSPHPTAIRGDGVEIHLVAVDRESTIKFEYYNPTFSGFFYARRDYDEQLDIQHFTVYRASFWQSVPSHRPEDHELEQMWLDIAAAFRAWPDDFFDQQSSPEKENTVDFR